MKQGSRRCTRHSDVKIAKRSSSTQRVPKPNEKLIETPIEKPIKDSIGKKVEELQGDVQMKSKQKVYELSPLMTSIVEDELRDIMINVWQTLPEDVTHEIEKPVVEKFLGAAGDDLRNTIGLNLSKRLLSVNSGILVKVVVHGPVAQAELERFADDHEIAELKHVASRIYAGRLKSWPELDYLFRNLDLRCGSSRVSVTPVYHFMTCPASLKTIYDGTRDYSRHKEAEIDTARNITRQNSAKVLETADKVLAQANKKTAAKKAKDTKVINKPKEVKTVDKKNESVDKPKTTPTKAVLDTKTATTGNIIDKKPANKPQSNSVANKDVTPSKESAKTVVVKPSTVNNAKTEVAKPKPNEVKHAANTAKVEPTKVDTKAQTTVKKEANNAIAVDKQTAPTPNENKKLVATVKPTKTEETKAADNEPLTPITTANKTVAKLNEDKKPEVNISKFEPTKTANNSVGATSNTPKVTPKKDAIKPNEVKKVEITAKSVLEKADNAKAVAAKTNPPKTVPVKTTPLTSALSKTTPDKTASAKAVPAKTEPAKPTSAKTETAKTTPAKAVQPKTEPATMTTAKAVPIKTTPAKAVPDKTILPKAVPSKTILPKAVPDKTPPAKTVPAKTTPAKTVPVKTTPAKTVPAKTTPAKTVPAKKTSAKTVPAKSAKTSKVEKKAPKESDFDELDDHDILAMLSSGIVLDECSGSDDE